MSEHVAWCRYQPAKGDSKKIVLCDSDAPGAFRVYRVKHKGDGASETAAFLLRLDAKGVPCQELAARVSKPIEFRPQRSGRTAFGYEATILTEIWGGMMPRSRLAVNGKVGRMRRRSNPLMSQVYSCLIFPRLHRSDTMPPLEGRGVDPNFLRKFREAMSGAMLEASTSSDAPRRDCECGRKCYGEKCSDCWGKALNALRSPHYRKTLDEKDSP